MDAENNAFALFTVLFIFVRSSARKARAKGSIRREGKRWRSRNEHGYACAYARDQERSPIVRAGTRCKKITKSPFFCVSSLVTSRKVRSVATPVCRQRVALIRPASTGRYRSYQGGEARVVSYICSGRL